MKGFFKDIRKIFCLAVLLSSFIFISCGRPAPDKMVDLSSGWLYAVRNPALEGTVFAELTPEKMENLHKLVSEQKGTVWLRKNFSIPEGLKGKDLAVYLGRITLADKTYFNGILIGHEGYFPPHEFSAWNTTRFYDIPENIINQYGTNTILIEVFVDGEGSIISNPFLGEYQDAKNAAAKERFWNSQLLAWFAFAMVIVGFYHLMVWRKSRSQKEALWFALINFISVIYMLVFYISEIPGLPSPKINFLWFQKIFSCSLLFTLPFLITTFVNEYLKRKDNKVIRIIRISVLIIPMMIVMAAPNYYYLRQWRPFYQPWFLPPIAYMVFRLFKAVIKKEQDDALPLLLGFTPFLITAALDFITHDILKMYTLPYITSIGWQLVILALLIVLANRFSNARNRAEYLNKHLKDEVDQRTIDLTKSNQELTVVNAKLEVAQMRAEEDMRLAVYVQQSFFPRWVPSVDDWEVAYVFKPNAGVSGDLYDFFSEGNSLTGLALFDVSGHGIASGLVTMIAKNAISRKFSSDMNVKLATIMKDINKEIITDKGDVQNYLTGVLLRLHGNQVQYVNAGHPAIFYRNAKTGKTQTVRMTKEIAEDNTCTLVGIPELDVDFKALQFNMEKGDALILYTDCLSESRNDAGTEWGQDSVCQAFANSGNGNAQSKLDFVMRQFDRYTEGVALRDDLTVIVLQKK